MFSLFFSNKKQKVLLIFVLLIIALLFYVLNLQTPLFADDYSYCYSFYNGERISNFGDIFSSLKAHYYSANGRVVSHFFAQLFLLIGKNYFNVFNSVSFLFLGFLIVWHGKGGKLKDNIPSLIFVYCSLFMFVPAFGQSFLWLDGSSNYLYGIELILIFLLPFRFWRRTDKEIHSCILISILGLFGMLFLGVVSGATNENTSIALIVMIVGFVIYYKKRGIRLAPWMFSGLVGNILGCLFMLTAPGELSRMDKAGGIDVVKILKNIVYITLTIADYFPILIFIFALLFFLYIYSKNDVVITRVLLYDEMNHFFVTIIYILGFLASTYSMIISPGFPDRVWSGPLILLLITLLCFYTDVKTEFDKDVFLKFDRELFVRLKSVFYCVFFLISICVYGKALYELMKVNEQNNVRVEMIVKQKKSGKETISIPSIKSDSKYSCFESDGDLVWGLGGMAKYYGVSKVLRDDNITLKEGEFFAK